MPPLLRAEEESKRVKVRIAEVLADNGMELGERKAEVADLFADTLAGFHLKHDKLEKK